MKAFLAWRAALLLAVVPGVPSVAAPAPVPPGSALFVTPLPERSTFGGLRVSSDQKILLWGSFGTNWALRLNADGSIDDSFKPEAATGWRLRSPYAGQVLTTAFQTDGKILVGGELVVRTTPPRYGAVRCLADGSRDESFTADLGTGTVVSDMDVQPDGKVLVRGTLRIPQRAGVFTVVRLNADGSFDPTFRVPQIESYSIRLMVVAGTGEFYVGGQVGRVNGQLRNAYARFLADGSLDTGFQPALGLASGASIPFIETLLPLPDGRVVVGGEIETVSGVPRRNIYRVDRTGRLDESFDAGEMVGSPYSSVSLIGRERSGRLLIAGGFSSVGGQVRQGLARLNEDGSVDTGYGADLAFNSAIKGLATMADDSAIVVDSGRVIRLAGGDAAPAPPRWLVQPRSYKAVFGETVSFGVGVASAEPPRFQWYRNGNRIPNATNAVLVLRNATPLDLGAYYASASNALGSQDSQVAVLSVTARSDEPGEADETFDTGSGPDGLVRSIQIGSDGSILIAGSFSSFNDVPRGRIARLLANGRLDPSWTAAEGFDGEVLTTQWLGDGRILAGGAFARYGSQSRSNLCRLNSDGTFDPTWNIGLGPAGRVTALALVPDGRIIVAGNFQKFDGEDHARVVRLLEDGRPDPSFRAAAPQGAVTSVGADSDGRVLLGGTFTTVAGVTRMGLARLLPDGGLDESFNPGWGVAGIDTVNGLLRLRDGSWLVGGRIAWANDQGCFGVFKLDTSGGIDPAFSSSLVQAAERQFAQTRIVCMAQAPDGGIYVGGNEIHSTAHPNLGRMMEDGSVDGRFASNARASQYIFSAAGVTAIAAQADGKVIVAGEFEQLGGLFRRNLTRLHGGPPASRRAPRPDQLYNDALSDSQTHRPRATSTIVIKAGQDLIWKSTTFASDPVERQWQVNGVDLPGETNTFLAVRNVTETAGSTRVWIRNGDGVAVSAESTFRLDNPPPKAGKPDLAFCGPAPVNGRVRVVLGLPGGEVMVGGNFTTLGGKRRPLIARLSAHGDLAAYGPEWDRTEGLVWSLATVSDGKVLVGGDFVATHAATGETNAVLVRLAAGGDVDRSFAAVFNSGGEVRATAVHTNGSIAVGGLFASINGQKHLNVALLDPDGSPSPGFRARTDGIVTDLAWRQDGSLVVVGDFQTVNDEPRPAVAVLDPTGQLVRDFSAVPAPDGSVRTVAVYPDGGLLIGGDFEMLGNQFASLLARLSPSGRPDPEFEPDLSGMLVQDVLVQPDGRILVAGDFDSFFGPSRIGFARLLPGGEIDSSFDTGLGLSFPEDTGNATSLSLDDDGNVLMGGFFSHVDGIHRARIAKVWGQDPDPIPPRQTLPSFDRTARVGDRVRLTAGVRSLWPTTWNWRLADAPASAPPVGTEPSLVLSNITANLAGSYVLSAVSMGKETAFDPIRLIVNPAAHRAGLPDASSFVGRGTDGPVFAISRVPDDGFLIGGAFTRLNGLARPGIARIREDGSVDERFGFRDVTAAVVPSLVREAAGSFLVGGRVTFGDGRVRSLVRLSSDAVVDPRLQIEVDLHGDIRAILPLPDGGILFGGSFTQVNGEARNRLGRWNADGVLDSAFTPDLDGTVQCLLALGDGTIVVGGDFERVNGQRRQGIACLLPDGSLSPQTPGADLASGVTHALALDREGAVLVGGRFELGSVPEPASLLRWNLGGETAALCRSFLGADRAGEVFAVATTPEGDVLVGGSFMAVGAPVPGARPLVRAGVARIKADGSPDFGFDPGPGIEGFGESTGVRAIVTESDGNVVIGGSFAQVGGLPRSGLARLIGTNAPARLTDRPPTFTQTYSIGRFLFEGALLETALFVADPDTPLTNLTFSLVGAVPEGMEINPNTGLIRWNPSETQGPATYPIQIRMQDTSEPPLEALLTIPFTVYEVNRAPLFPSAAVREVRAGETLSFRVAVQDPDVPGNRLWVWLGRNPPEGCSLDPETFLFSWTPPLDHPPGPVVVEIFASDGEVDGITQAQFTVDVVEPAVRIVAAASLSQGRFRIAWSSRISVRYRIQWRDDLSSGEWEDSGEVIEGKPVQTSAEFNPSESSGRFFRIVQQE